jgi:hypothetical protein
VWFTLVDYRVPVRNREVHKFYLLVENLPTDITNNRCFKTVKYTVPTVCFEEASQREALKFGYESLFLWALGEIRPCSSHHDGNLSIFKKEEMVVTRKKYFLANSCFE